MSTRCQIDFVNNYTINSKLRTDRVRVYRHSDGYPDSKYGVIATLKKFLKWNNGRNDDCEYTAANFILWSKLNSIHDRNVGGDFSEKHTIESILFSNKQDFNASFLVGYGVCNLKDFHSDIAYYYEVIVNLNNKSIKIKVYEPTLTDKDETKLHLFKTVTVKKANKGGNLNAGIC